MLAAIRLYQAVLSPRRPARCRFTPTCSSFAATAITRHGVAAGAAMTARRLRDCRPEVPRGTVYPVL
ncbi:hypothetical protein UG55_1007205 [Frankia sp. EI5c]|nr:hypothetical protein UG55_1007205 [Frankia sp. EI5c]